MSLPMKLHTEVKSFYGFLRCRSNTYWSVTRYYD
ncbi:unnamed protein product [Angiostrongylus costaricensis]|uniref:Uncharacterized protein n=1 Tax=Angiostrongylus costaricensis TaxID=334426 RepID=A0A0R3PCQ4_ANGCS|nr:unnamed protein product [Angiostrongylus costaricensis]